MLAISRTRGTATGGKESNERKFVVFDGCPGRGGMPPVVFLHDQVDDARSGIGARMLAVPCDDNRDAGEVFTCRVQATEETELSLQLLQNDGTREGSAILISISAAQGVNKSLESAARLQSCTTQALLSIIRGAEYPEVFPKVEREPNFPAVWARCVFWIWIPENVVPFTASAHDLLQRIRVPEPSASRMSLAEGFYRCFLEIEKGDEDENTFAGSLNIEIADSEIPCKKKCKVEVIRQGNATERTVVLLDEVRLFSIAETMSWEQIAKFGPVQSPKSETGRKGMYIDPGDVDEPTLNHVRRYLENCAYGPRSGDLLSEEASVKLRVTLPTVTSGGTRNLSEVSLFLLSVLVFVESDNYKNTPYHVSHGLGCYSSICRERLCP